MLAQRCDLLEWKSVWAGVLSCCTWLVGGFDVSVLALLILWGMDFVLGFWRAWRGRTLNAARFRRGLRKSLLYMAALTAANLLDMTLKPMPVGMFLVRNFMILFIAVGEFLSISVHLADLGVPLPKALLERLRSYRDHPEQCVGLGGPVFGGAPGSPGFPPQAGPFPCGTGFPPQPGTMTPGSSAKPSDFDDGSVR